MNFLNQAAKSATKATNGGATPLNNPFLKPASATQATTVKPIVPGNKPGAAPIPGARPAGLPLPKPQIGLKPAIPGAKPNLLGKPSPVSAAKEEVKEESVVAKTEAAPIATTPEVAETPVVEETVVEKVEPKQEKTTTKVTANRKTDKKTSKKKEQTASEKDDSYMSDIPDEITVPVTNISYTEAVQAIKSDFVDEEWDTFRAETEEKITGIIIDSGMNKSQINDLLSQISVLRDEVIVSYTDTKTLFETLTNKEDGLIDRVKRLNAKGTNAEERKVTGTIAVMNYKDKASNNINLYELLDETRNRYNFLRSVMDTVDFKKGVLLTMLSAFKNEK